MTTQEAIEIVKKTHPFATKYQTDEECIALQHLINVAEGTISLKERLGIEINGKWTPLLELPNDTDELDKIIKAEKLQRSAI